MENEYRIKEVKIPLKSGELIVFYPQIKGNEKETTGRLWWKKTTFKEVWHFFYKIGDVCYIDNYTEREKLLYFESILLAEIFIKDFKLKLLEDTKKYWIKNSSAWDDKRYVKYHKVENVSENKIEDDKKDK